ncbi:Glycyl-tRNA synthetase [Acidilobus saccharovorans 345-15]|uniref:Glycine--tRNA ligase n=1 Tax=Acidilobus saccharovorans (strain DSM 16705 / JCM 18335 / VKM B-2471 / 345-15) TaxID=666510 RepID=D9PZQ7_ACIS3|nr:glycine--tRNA ligase [Acidilobus saccharovorans]ADL18545.1 Glycyl-tRNA synthetase [Acidilobus saccharovorans 345-15]
MTEDIYDKIVDLAKRRGFFWPSYEIYGGLAGFYDIGPYGLTVKRKIIEAWRRLFVFNHQDYVVEIETPAVGPSIVYEASGHVESFTDPVVRCTKCGRIYRADHLVEDALKVSAEGLSPEELTRKIRENNIRCPVCGGELSEVSTFNLLFKTQIGPYEGSVGYIRPELAQGMFVSFRRVLETMRNRMPLGIAQVGRVGRNEISPRQGMIRLRDFTIMEMEFFFDPQSGQCPNLDRVMDRKLRVRQYKVRLEGGGPQEFTVRELIEKKVVAHPCMAYWMTVGLDLVKYIGVTEDETFFEEKGPKEKAHYATQVFDQLVRTSRWGWVEVAGYAYRGDYDLSRHMKYSGQDLKVFEPYKEPRVEKVKKVLVDLAYAGRTYRSRASEAVKLAESLPAEEAERQLREMGKLRVGDFEFPASAVKIVEVEQKVSGRSYTPHVVEPSFGTDRLLYVALERAYREKEGRVVLSLPRYLAPVDAAVFPLIEGEEKLEARARQLRDLLVSAGFTVLYDDSGSIGKRYARADEIGVPAAFTVDYQTLEDGTVTLRDRDTWRQVRLRLEDAPEALKKFIYNLVDIAQLGKPVEPEG